MIHRKTAGVVTLAAVILLMLVGCQSGRQNNEANLQFDFGRLEVPSTYYFQMQDSAQVFGQMSQSLERVEEDGQSLLRATFKIFGGVKGETSILFDPVSGSPVSMKSSQVFQGVEVINNSFFEKDRVLRVLNAPVTDIQDSLYTDLEGPTFDWMQSTFILQSMELDTMIGDTLQLSFYQGFGTAFVSPADIVIMGVEQVEVPAGEFAAYHVHIDYAGALADLYIEEGGERRLLKHEVPGRVGTVSTVLIPASEVEKDG